MAHDRLEFFLDDFADSLSHAWEITCESREWDGWPKCIFHRDEWPIHVEEYVSSEEQRRRLRFNAGCLLQALTERRESYPPSLYLEAAAKLNAAIGLLARELPETATLAATLGDEIRDVVARMEMADDMREVCADHLLPAAAQGDGAADAVKGTESYDARAVVEKFNHPDWTDQQIADAIGCARQTLFKPNMPNFKLAKAAIAAGRTRYRRDF